MPPSPWSRRAFLASIAVAKLAAQKLPSERKTYRDRTTEFTFSRINAATCSAWLPAPNCRMFARRARFLLHASDRNGGSQAWAMDLKSGELRLLTAAAQIDPASLSLLPDERSFCYIDGSALYLEQIGKDGLVKDPKAKALKLADLPGHDAAKGSGIAISADGQLAVLVSGNRLLRVNLPRGGSAVLAAFDPAAPDVPRAPMFHPRRNEIAYFAGNTVMTLKLDGSKPNAVPLPDGRILDAHWSPAKETDALLYLHQPDAADRTVSLREYDFAMKRDRRLALTSQFASFSPNADASVFAGASFSKAQPHVLMLVRSVARELTLCEHNATDAAKVTPVFTPDSREIFFQSNREGKPAIYSIAVEKLVETTEEDSPQGQDK